MAFKIKKTVQKHSLWLSLLIHFMLLASYVIILPLSAVPPLKKVEPLPSYVPAYVENSDIQTPKELETTPVQQPPAKSKVKVADKEKPIDKRGIEKPQAPKSAPVQQQAAKPSAPREIKFARNQIPEELSNPQNREQMHLIGDSKIIKPIIKLLAKSLSEHLIYPKIAQDFNLRGIVLVGFVLHPQGYVTETKIVKSSGAGVLDDAARNAVKGMSPVQGVGPYLQQSEFMVVGIIFGG